MQCLSPRLGVGLGEDPAITRWAWRLACVLSVGGDLLGRVGGFACYREPYKWPLDGLKRLPPSAVYPQLGQLPAAP